MTSEPQENDVAAVAEVATANGSNAGGDDEEVGDSAFPPGDMLERRALQRRLKQWKVPATGTTAALRTRYDVERSKRSSSEQQSSGQATTQERRKAKKSTAVAVAAAPEEKRRRPFRSSCPDGIRQRIMRAKTERLYLIHRGTIENNKCDFAVLGSTGNIYTVTITHLSKCSCPDFARGHNHTCKHMLFVLLKVMAIDEDSPYLYQAAWLTSELQEMFATFVERRGPSNESEAAILANDQVRQAYAKIQAGETWKEEDQVEEPNGSGIVRKALDEENSDCPICFDSMLDDAPAKLTFCRTACGYNFHIDCIRRWCEQQQRSTSAPATCPNCRQPWEVKGKSTGDTAKANEGYTNLGQLQGQSPVRDVSTYSGWNGRKRRRYY